MNIIRPAAPAGAPVTAAQPDPVHAATLQAVRLLAARGAEFSGAAVGSLTDQLAVCLAANLADAWLRPAPDCGFDQDTPSTQFLSAAPPNPQFAIRNSQGPPSPAAADPLQRVKEFCPLLAVLRRGDQYAESLQIRRQRLQLAIQRHQDRLAAQKTKTGLPFRFPNPDGGITDETIARIEHDLKLF